MAWRAWYADGREFDSESHGMSWEGLPSDGMIFCMLFEHQVDTSGNHLRRGMQGGDWYWQADGLLDTIYAHERGEAPPSSDRYKNITIIRGQWADGVLMGRVEDQAGGSKKP